MWTDSETTKMKLDIMVNTYNDKIDYKTKRLPVETIEKDLKLLEELKKVIQYNGVDTLEQI